MSENPIFNCAYGDPPADAVPEPRAEDPDLAADRRRNTVVLAASLALTWSVVQLAAGFAAITLSQLLGRTGFAGLAPALLLAGWAAAGPPAGRLMDARGRRPGIAAGFVAGVAVCLLLWFSTDRELVAPFLAGIALIGFVCGWLNLGARAGAADMYPAARRARGLGFVLTGAALGAILAPLLFAPLLRGAAHDSSRLAAPWLVGAAVMAAGAVLVFAIRRDPIRFPSERGAAGAAGPARPVITLLRLPLVAGALVAAVVAQGVMSSIMTVIGVAMRDHGHDLDGVSFAVSVHFLGMFALVLVVGVLVDRIGRRRSMLAGLAIVSVSAGALAAEAGFGSVLPAMFALGVGWNVAFVGATALMADATEANERARLLGFGDFLAAGVAAAGTIAAAAILDVAGMPALAAVGGGLALVALLTSGSRATAAPGDLSVDSPR